MSETIKFNKGDVIIQEGGAGNEMFYVESGTLSVVQKKGSEDVQIGTVFSGEVIGEMSFLDHGPRCATVKAMSDCELVVIRPEKFKSDIESLPVWYKALVSTLLERLRKANKKIKI